MGNIAYEQFIGHQAFVGEPQIASKSGAVFRVTLLVHVPYRNVPIETFNTGYYKVDNIYIYIFGSLVP